jgi:hypothetical protein
LGVAAGSVWLVGKRASMPGWCCRMAHERVPRVRRRRGRIPVAALASLATALVPQSRRTPLRIAAGAAPPPLPRATAPPAMPWLLETPGPRLLPPLPRLLASTLFMPRLGTAKLPLRRC